MVGEAARSCSALSEIQFILFSHVVVDVVARDLMTPTVQANWAKVAELTTSVPRPAGVTLSYGTAGFRAKATLLPSTFLRMGYLATLRAQQTSQVRLRNVATCGAGYIPCCVSTACRHKRMRTGAPRGFLHFSCCASMGGVSDRRGLLRALRSGRPDHRRHDHGIAQPTGRPRIEAEARAVRRAEQAAVCE
jgi:hypothetical protein